MKQILVFSLFAFSLLSLNACKNDKKAPATDKKTEKVDVPKKEVKKAPKKDGVRIRPSSVEVKWTAFKMTDKVPVSGIFKTVKIEKLHVGKTMIEAVNGLEFSIPIDSVFTKNKGRDKIIVTSFFGKLKETANILGTVNLKSKEDASVLLTMNGISEKLPVVMSWENNKVTMKATLDLKTWKGEIAVAALNEACGDLHKGKDGVSKTWDEVNIVVSGIVEKALLK